MRRGWAAALFWTAPVFGAPPLWTQPWLADPIARSGPIVVLLEGANVVYTAPEQARSRVRWIGRLQRPSGIADMNFSVSYNGLCEQITAADAWVIESGGRTHHYAQSDFLDVASDAGRDYWTKMRRLVFPAEGHVAVGDTLAVEVTKVQTGLMEVDWQFPSRSVVSQEYLRVAPPPGDRLVWRASSNSIPKPAVDASGTVTWRSAPLPQPSERWLPSAYLANPECVQVRPARSEIATWPSTAVLAASLVDDRIVVSPEVKRQAEALVGGHAGRWDRIRALTEFTQEKIVYLSLLDGTDSLAGCRPHLPSEVLASRFGDCKDKAALLVALLRAIGDDGRVLLVKAGDPNAIDPQWPSLLFNHAIVAIPAAGAPLSWPRVDGGALGPMVVFDPTNPVVPLGVLPESDQGGWALLVDASRGKLVRLPRPVGANVKSTTIEAEMDGSGELLIHSHRVFRGTGAAGIYALAKDSPADRMTETWLNAVSGFTPFPHDLSWKAAWDRPAAEYRLDLTYRSRAGRYLGETLMALTPQFAQGSPKFAPWRTEAEGVAWITDQTYRCHTHVRLPAGWTVEEMPDDWIRRGSTVNAEIHYQAADGFLTYDSELVLKPGFYGREQYEKIRRFMLRVAEAEDRPVILRFHPAAPPAAHS